MSRILTISPWLLFAVVVGVVPAVAQAPPDPDSVSDLFVPATEGLTITTLCRLDAALGDDGLPATGDPNEAQGSICVVGHGGAAEGFAIDGVPFGPVVSGHLRYEFVPDPGAACPSGPIGYPYAFGSWHLDRIAPDGALVPVGEFRTQCEDGFTRDIVMISAAFDQVEGVVYVNMVAFNSQQIGVSSRGVNFSLRISGLPTLLDLLPAEPPGLSRFPDSPSDPHPFAPDPGQNLARLAALEQQMEVVRSQIAALRAALVQIRDPAATPIPELTPSDPPSLD